MPKLNHAQWDAVRRLWEGSYAAGFSWLTAASGGPFAVSRESIRRRCQVEGWVKKKPLPDPEVDGRGCRGDFAAGDVAGGVFDADFSIEDLAPGDGLEADRDRLLVLHRRDWVALRRLASAAVAEGTIEAARRVEHQA